MSGDDLDFDGVGDDAIDGGFDERVQSPVFSTHKVRFEDVPAAAVVLEHAVIEHHAQVLRLKVERHQLAAGVPVHLRRVVGRVDARAFRVNARELALVVIDKVDGMLLEQPRGLGFSEGGALERVTAFLRFVEGKEADGLDVVDLGKGENVIIHYIQEDAVNFSSHGKIRDFGKPKEKSLRKELVEEKSLSKKIFKYSGTPQQRILIKETGQINWKNASPLYVPD